MMSVYDTTYHNRDMVVKRVLRIRTFRQDPYVYLLTDQKIMCILHHRNPHLAPRPAFFGIRNMNVEFWFHKTGPPLTSVIQTMPLTVRQNIYNGLCDDLKEIHSAKVIVRGMEPWTFLYNEAQQRAQFANFEMARYDGGEIVLRDNFGDLDYDTHDDWKFLALNIAFLEDASSLNWSEPKRIEFALSLCPKLRDCLSSKPYVVLSTSDTYEHDSTDNGITDVDTDESRNNSPCKPTSPKRKLPQDSSTSLPKRLKSCCNVQ
jgi:hypothetical protein